MATGLGRKSLLGGFRGRLFFIGLALLMAVVLAACGNDPQPAAPEQQGADSAATNPEPAASGEPAASPVPSPTESTAAMEKPTPAAAPTTRPPSAVTVDRNPGSQPTVPAPALGGPSGEHEFAIGAGTLWQDLFDLLAPYEQSCIRRELGDELDSVLKQPAMPGMETRPWEVTVFQCLDPETASGIFLSGITQDMQGLPPEGLTCVQELVTGADVAGLVAASSPEAGLAGGQVLNAFTAGLMECMLGQMMTGAGGMSGVSPPADESMIWGYATGGWVGNSPVVNGGAVYAGSDDAHVYALEAETGELLWSFETGDAIKSSPTVTGGAVYVGSNDNHVYALDAATGGLRWKYDTGGWAQFSPAVTGRFVFLGAHGDGGYMVRALDASSGEQVWVAEMPSPPSADFAPVVIWDKVYLPGDWGEFHALEASTGKAAWSFDTGIPSDSPPTVRDGVLYLTAVNNAFAIDEETGDLIWSYGTETFPARDFPAVIADGVYYFSPNNRLYALDAAKGEPIWSYETDNLITTTPVTARGVVYVGDESRRFYALDAATGALLWRHEGGDYGLESVTVTGGVLYAESSDGRLRALNALTGEEVWGFEKGYFSDTRAYTVVDGVVYLGSFNGSIYAFTVPEVN